MTASRKVGSVNVARPEPVQVGGRTVVSGIGKQPQVGRVTVGPLGLSGDHILNARHHGGPDQAVYLYSAEDYDHFAPQLGALMRPGLFGENLTVSGLVSGELRVGDRLRFPGQAGLLLEVSAARIPCDTFAAWLDDPGFVKTFRQARRPGAYLRVLEPGTAAAGDPFTLEAGDPDAPTLAEQFELHYTPHPAREQLERSLRFPVAARARADYLKRLAKLDKVEVGSRE